MDGRTEAVMRRCPGCAALFQPHEAVLGLEIKEVSCAYQASEFKAVCARAN